MRKINIFMTLVFMLSCDAPTKDTYKGKVTSFIINHQDSQSYIYEKNIPEVIFDLTIINQSREDVTINVKDYMREPLSNSGSFWLYFNEGYDSLELFSASCKNCLDSILIAPSDSIALTLKPEYHEIIKGPNVVNSNKGVKNKLEEISRTWILIKYLDVSDKQIFAIHR